MVSYNNKESQTLLKEEASEGEPLKCDIQDWSHPETIDIIT